MLIFSLTALWFKKKKKKKKKEEHVALVKCIDIFGNEAWFGKGHVHLINGYFHGYGQLNDQGQNLIIPELSYNLWQKLVGTKSENRSFVMP